MDSFEQVDWQAALAMVDNRRELLIELVQIFFVEYPQLVADIRRSIDANDPQTLQLNAHRLKGCLRYFGRPLAADLSSQLEDIGRSGTVDGGLPLWEQLQTALDRLLPTLQHYVEEASGS